MDRGKFGETEKDSVAETLGLEYPFIDPADTVLPAPFTDKLLQRIIYLHCFFLLSNLSSRLSTTLLVRQLTSMLASQRNILLSLYYLASQQYLEVSHSFLGQSLFLVSVTSHIFLFIYLF